MFDTPGFSPGAMTDDELLKKQDLISRRLAWAGRFSASTEMVYQLHSMLTAIDTERRERMMKSMFNERLKMFPEIIETEPDLAILHRRQAEIAEEESKLTQRRRSGRERQTYIKTAAPVGTSTKAIHEIPKRTATPAPVDAPVEKDDPDA
jgi:excinuclease UvrABC helicase subunit UvrB